MRKNTSKILVGAILALALLLPGCSKKKGEEPAPPSDPAGAAVEGALSPAAAGGTAATAAAPGGAEAPSGAPSGTAPGGPAGLTEGPAAPAAKVTLVEFPPVENPAPAGSAWFVVRSFGLVRLDENGFQKIEAPEENIKQIALAPDGTLWAIGYQGLYKLQDGRLSKIGGRRKGADAMAVGPQGDVWLADFTDVAHFDGTAWTTEPKSALEGVSLFKGLAVDSSGRVWAASANAIHSREADGWKAADLSGLGEYQFFLESIVAGADGTLYAGEMRGLLKFSDGKWTRVSLGEDTFGWGSASQLAIGAGRVVVGYTLGELVGLLPDGRLVQKQWSDEPKGDYLYAMTVDGAGRIWVSSDAGLAVLPPGGGSTPYAPGTIPEVPGRIEMIAIAGGGPALPAVGEVRTGTVQGSIVKAGQPLAGATMELCPSPASMFRETPCTESPFHLTTKTTAEGVFTFENVPIGTYGFAVEVNGQWAKSFMEDCCEEMQPGQVYVTGTFEMD